MLQRRLSILSVGSVWALTAACASVLGIEDATCDPSYDVECAGNGSDGSEQTEAFANVGRGGSESSPDPRDIGASGGSAPTPSSGAGGASATPTNSPTANGGTAGSSMASAGAAGSAGIAATIDPFEARASTLCREYCATVGANCTGTNQQYASSTACFAVCELLPPGSAGETTPSNTVQCRMRRAALAGTTGEPGNYCYSAGPGGAEECGSDCDGFCALMTQKCGDDMGPLNQCLSACSIIPDLSRPPDNLHYNVSQQAGDSLQCRLFHVSAASVDPVGHCVHAAGGSPCSL